MKLPGGMITGGEVRRSFHFKPVTGSLELSLSQSARGARNHPERVTRVLVEALADIGGRQVTKDDLRHLCVGDRQYLMRALEAHIDDAPNWLSAECGHCGELFDVPVRHSELPCKRAGDEFPETDIEIRGAPYRVRIPTGADQEKISLMADSRAALDGLLKRLLTPQETGLDISSFCDEEIAAIEAVVEEMSPEVATHIGTTCPACQADNRVPVSPYACLQKQPGDLLAQIHSLATHYHWSEAEILSLPRGRRQTYLSLIDESRGFRGADTYLAAAGE